MMEDEPPQSVVAGTVVASRYRTERRIGAGGMGEVYLVQHVHTDERFAMKVLLSTVIADENALERFRREARTPARIDSEHVVRVTDADVAPELKGAPFLVMEYLRGEDLDRHVSEQGMAPRDVVLYLKQVARALDKAHALGIIHRDLKPENIFITKREDGSPHVKILDFGIAKFTSGATSDMISKTATSPGQIYGTPLYMAPEQAKGESQKISPQTDIWALGLIANRMLTGKDYWDAETLTALIAQVVYEPMLKPSEKGFAFGAAYDEWFLQCCNRDPDVRFGSAGEAVSKLALALGIADDSFPLSRPSNMVIAPPPSLRQASEPRPLSRTELQLAQTGISPPRSERGSFIKVVVGLGAVGLLVGAVVLAMGGSKKEPAANPETRTSGTSATSVASSKQGSPQPVVVAVQSSPAVVASSAEPLASTSVSAGVEASASASVSAGASASSPRASASAVKTSSPPASSGSSKPKTVPSTPTSQPPPPKSANPLEGRL